MSENGDGPGVRLRRASFRGKLRARPLKAGSAWVARFEPMGYGPTRDYGHFETERAAEDWIEIKKRELWVALTAAMKNVSMRRPHHSSALNRVLEDFRNPSSDFIEEGIAQEHLGRALEWLRGTANLSGTAAFQDVSEEVFETFKEQIMRAGLDKR